MPVVEHKQHFFLVHPCVRARKFYCWKIGTSLSNGCAEATKKMCAFHFDRLFWWYFFFIFLPLLLLQRFFANLTRFHIGVRACVSRESYWRGFCEQQVSIEVEISYIIFFISFGKFDFWAVFLTHQKRYVCATAWTKITVWLLYGCDDGREREGATRKETKNKPCHHSWFLLLHFHFRSTWWFISDDSHNGEIIKRLNAHTHPLTQQRRLYTLCRLTVYVGGNLSSASTFLDIPLTRKKKYLSLPFIYTRIWRILFRFVCFEFREFVPQLLKPFVDLWTLAIKIKPQMNGFMLPRYIYEWFEGSFIFLCFFAVFSHRL